MCGSLSSLFGRDAWDAGAVAPSWGDRRRRVLTRAEALLRRLIREDPDAGVAARSGRVLDGEPFEAA